MRRKSEQRNDRLRRRIITTVNMARRLVGRNGSSNRAWPLAANTMTSHYIDETCCSLPRGGIFHSTEWPSFPDGMEQCILKNKIKRCTWFFQSSRVESESRIRQRGLNPIQYLMLDKVTEGPGLAGPGRGWMCRWRSGGSGRTP